MTVVVLVVMVIADVDEATGFGAVGNDRRPREVVGMGVADSGAFRYAAGSVSVSEVAGLSVGFRALCGNDAVR